MSSKRITQISHWKKLVHQPVNLNVPINLIDSWHSLPCTVCGSVSYKKTKQDKKKKKIIIREACLDERIWQDVWQVTVMRCQKRVGGGARGWNFATGTKEDLCLLLWQRDSQLRRQYEATRRDELLVQDCLYIYFFFCPPPFHKRKWDSVCVWKKIGGQNKTKTTTHSCSYWQFCRCLDPHLKDKKKHVSLHGVGWRGSALQVNPASWSNWQTRS